MEGPFVLLPPSQLQAPQRASPVTPRISQGEAEECCEYLVKQGLLAKHPWGGFMVPLVKGAAVVPPAEAAKPMVLEELKRLGIADSAALLGEKEKLRRHLMP